MLFIVELSSIYFFKRQKTTKKLDQIILDLTTKLPEINFKCYEKIYNGYRISSSKFPYIFCMDISGNLNFDKEEFKNKHYLQLNIKKEIYTNDNETLNLFIHKKNQFYQAMTTARKWVDISIPEYNSTLLINIGNDSCCQFTNVMIYIIFVILSLGVIYHLILNSLIVEKTITIKKIIAIKFEIRIPIRNANGNEPQIRSKDEENIINIGETEIVIHNNGNKLKLKDNNLKKNQKEDEPNTNSERKNVLTNSRLNNPN